MAKKPPSPGESENNSLQAAMALLIQNQAAFVRDLRDIQRENAERFARIETILLEHSRILADHSRILADLTRLLQALPEAVREKIGFKPPAP